MSCRTVNCRKCLKKINKEEMQIIVSILRNVTCRFCSYNCIYKHVQKRIKQNRAIKHEK